MSGGGGGTTTVREQIDPAMRPFVRYGLDEAKRLYQSDTPNYFPGKTYVDPNQQTLTALNMAQQRAISGNPLVANAQAAVGRMQGQTNPFINAMAPTIGGAYLSGNPFFQGAFDAATNAARQKYVDDTQTIRSQASRAGRYGSGSMNELQDRANSAFATALTDTAGKLAYSNFARERAAQEAAAARAAQITGQDLQRQLYAAQMAPTLAQADYQDIDKLLKIGQIGEGYQEAALADAIARFDFGQQRPYSKLSSFLSSAFGAPMGTERTQPIFRNRAANILGGAALGSAIGGKNYGGYGAGIGALAGLTGLLA